MSSSSNAPTTKKRNFHHSKNHVQQDVKIVKKVKKIPAISNETLLSTKTKANLAIAHCTRSQTALRSKENQLSNAKSDKSNLDCLGQRNLDRKSDIYISTDCFPKKKARCKPLGCAKTKQLCKRSKCASKCTNIRKSLIIEETTCRNAKRSISTSLNPDISLSIADLNGDMDNATDRHCELKTKICQLRQRIRQEQLVVNRLQEQLARGRDIARTSLNYRRIRIQRELRKVRENVQLEDRRRLRLQKVRINRVLEANRRKLEDDKLSMCLAKKKEWQDLYKQKFTSVQSAKRAVQQQHRKHLSDSRSLLQQINKDWSLVKESLWKMRDTYESMLFKDGRQWNGVHWTDTVRAHTYSLRRAPRQKTNTYCTSRKKADKKTKTCPPNGGTVYKEFKQQTLTELYQVTENELRCSICSEVFISAVVLKCSHTFCSYCIIQWKKRTDKCPICRAPITATNSIGKLDTLISKMVRKVGVEFERKRAEAIKDRQGKEKELKEQGRSWGNFASHSLNDYENYEFFDENHLVRNAADLIDILRLRLPDEDFGSDDDDDNDDGFTDYDDDDDDDEDDVHIYSEDDDDDDDIDDDDSSFGIPDFLLDDDEDFYGHMMETSSSFDDSDEDVEFF